MQQKRGELAGGREEQRRNQKKPKGNDIQEESVIDLKRWKTAAAKPLLSFKRQLTSSPSAHYIRGRSAEQRARFTWRF